MESLDAVETISQADDLLPEAPLYYSLLHETMLLRDEVASSSRLSHVLNNIDNLKGFSLAEVIRQANTSEPEQVPMDVPSVIVSRPPLLFRDLDWAPSRPQSWPIRSGDYSPLSPDGELLERSGKIGLDFWRWHRDTAPLGYTPPLCTCKRTKDAQETLRRYARGVLHSLEKRVCDNDVCRGLLYIPHSLLEVPLNRVISNGSEFVKNVDVPNETDVYCGNMKHTLVICTTSPEHEAECIKAIRNSDVPDSLIYQVSNPGFIPYFKKYVASSSLAPLMTVEPIDSDVSESEENYGFGETFAVKPSPSGLIIHKYNTVSKTVSPLETTMLRSWMGGSEVSSDSLPEQAPVTSVKDYMLFELIESFSNERRPLSFTLGGSASSQPLGDDKMAASFFSKDRSHKRPLNEERKPTSDEAMESVHLMNIIDSLSGS